MFRVCALFCDYRFKKNMAGVFSLQYQHVNNRVCQVEYCTNRGHNCDLTFFLLSRDKTEKFEKWTRHIKLKPNAYVLKKIYICSDHFELRFFTSTLKRHLIRDAYPTLQRKKLEEAGPDIKQVEETHFVWNNMPQSKNSRNSSSNSEDMHVIASLYLPSDSSKSNEENLSEIEIIQRMFPKQKINHKLPVLVDKRFYENKDEFLEEVMDHYMKKRYFSKNEEENRRLFKEKVDSLKDPATLRNEWIAMKLTERYGPGVVAELSKQPSWNDIGKKMISEKIVKTSSTQNQVHFTPPVESQNSAMKCDQQCYVPSTSTVQSSTPTTLLVNQKNSTPSTVSDKNKIILPEKTNITCSTQNQVHLTGGIMVLSGQSEKTTVHCNPARCAPSASTVQMRTLRNLVNQKSSTPSTVNDKSEKVLPVTKTCSTQNQVHLAGGIRVLSDQSKNTTIACSPQSCASSTPTVQMRTPTNLINQKSSTPSTVNDKSEKVLPVTKTCSTQNQVHLAGGIRVFSDQSKNTTIACSPPSRASSTPTVQMRTPTNLINQKTSTPSAINDKHKKVVPEETTKACDSHNQVHLASPDLSQNSLINCDLQCSAPSSPTVQSITPTTPVSQQSSKPSLPSVQPKKVLMIPISTVLSKNLKLANQKGFIYSTSAIKSKNVVIDNLQNINPSTNTKQSKDEVETSQPRKVMKLMSTDSEISSSNFDHMYTKAVDSNTSTNCNLSVQQNLPLNKSKGDGIKEKDCDSIAADIANELKEIRDIQSRSEVLSKIQKLLEEAKSKACL